MTLAEAALVERVRRKQLAEDGCPQERIPDGNTALDDRSPDRVPENEEPGLIDSMKGM